jgi:TatD DNase family protein
MIDTHCHLTFPELRQRVGEVVAAAAAAGVDRMITVGTTPEDAADALDLTARHANVFVAAGLHPHYCERYTDRLAVVDALRELWTNPRVVAIGEMGIDYHYPDPPPDVQKRAFGWVLEAMAAHGTSASGRLLPGIIHNREATDDMLAMLRDYAIPGGPQRFVFHCFTGSAAELDQILQFGAMVSFTGIVTFGNAADLADLAARVPLDRIMIETDAPYLTPQPHRKVKPNEPRYVADVARFLAARRGMAVEQFVAITDANADRFFGLDRITG